MRSPAVAVVGGTAVLYTEGNDDEMFRMP